MSKRIIEIIPSPSPFRGRIDKFAVIPNIPTIAGKIPAKHPGHAPARIPKKVPIIPISPFFFETVFNFITLSIVKVMVVATKNGIIMKFKSAKEIANASLNDEKKFFNEKNVPLRNMFSAKKRMNEPTKLIGLSFIILSVFFIIIN